MEIPPVVNTLKGDHILTDFTTSVRELQCYLKFLFTFHRIW